MEAAEREIYSLFARFEPDWSVEKVRLSIDFH